MEVIRGNKNDIESALQPVSPFGSLIIGLASAHQSAVTKKLKILIYILVKKWYC